MKKAYLSLIMITFLVTLALVAEPADEHWPQWRGPGSNGNAHDNNPPTEWSESKNIKWKLPVPGKGSSSPIIWGEQIFITTAVPTGDAVQEAAPAREPAPSGGRRRGMRGVSPTEHKYIVMAIHRNNGDWQENSVILEL